MEPRSAAGSRSRGIDADAGGGSSGSGLPDQTHQLVARGHLTAADARALRSVSGGAGDHSSTSDPSFSARAGARSTDDACHHSANSLPSVADRLGVDRSEERRVGKEGRTQRAEEQEQENNAE